MIVDARSDFPTFTHRLAIAYQFADAFTGLLVRSPLVVTIPELRWTAVRSEQDFTYRFVVTNQDVPTGGPYDVVVTSTAGDYVALDPIDVTLPIVVAHPPPVRRSDYLVTLPLWPTRRFASVNETVVIGHVTSLGATPVDQLKVVLDRTPTSYGNARPFTRTDPHGDFLYRVPESKAWDSANNVPITQETLVITITDTNGNNVIPTPTQFPIDVGATQIVRFTIP